MLNQAAGRQRDSCEELGISPQQLSYVTQSGAGEGLLFYGNIHNSVYRPFPERYLKLYSYMTTIPEEVAGSE